MPRIQLLLTGSLAPIGPRSLPSGIAKTSVRRAALGQCGFQGDAQGDLRYHGGPEKAVHHYALDHYPQWIGEIGRREVLERAGAFGENLSTAGMDETTVAVGDIFRAGTALIQVSQGRQPCWKLNHRFDVPDMALRVQRTGRTGWYYRVIEPGMVAAGDELVLVDRPSPDWSIDRIRHAFYVDVHDREALTAIAGLRLLAENWRHHALRRLDSGRVDDWSRRLFG